MNQTLVRTISALALLILVVLSYILGETYLYTFVYILVFLMQIEVARFLFKKEAPTLVFLFVIHCFISTLVFNFIPEQFLFFILLSFISLTSGLIFSYHHHNDNPHLVDLIAKYLLGFFYVGILAGLPNKILSLEAGLSVLALCLATVFSGDICAYFIGKRFGQNKLFESISPTKTKEGALGGLIGSVAVCIVFGQFLFQEVDWPWFLFLGLFGGVFAQLGDSFESLLKRVAGIKDSGKIMPGHGGFLDRFDGVLFGLPIFYYAYYLFLNFPHLL